MSDIPVKCPSCSASEAKLIRAGCKDLLHGVAGEWNLLECRSCGLVYTTPFLDLNRLLDYYPTNYNPYNPAKSLRANFLGNTIRGGLMLPYRLFFGNPDWAEAPFGEKRLIDIGCGGGGFLAEATRQGWQCCGVDLSPVAVAAARARVPTARIENCELAALDAAEKFDFINMSHVLEHLPHPKEALRGCFERLRPSGKLRVVVPNFGGLESRVFGRAWIGLDVPRHLVHFRKEVISEHLREAGFTRIEIRPAMYASSISESVILGMPTLLRTRIAHTRMAHWLYLLAIFPAALSYVIGNAGAIEVKATRAG